MKLRPETALTFDDVLLVPRRSSIRSRHAVNTRTQLSRRLTLAIPVISSNMDTVTESAMAQAMARMGGIGVIHRFMMVDRQAAEVQRVKRAEGFLVENPYSIAADTTVWVSTVGDVAEWWKARAGLVVTARVVADQLTVDVRNRGTGMVTGAVARVEIGSTRVARRGTIPLLEAPPGVVRFALPPMGPGARRTVTASVGAP